MKQLLETSVIATYEERIKSTYAISCESMVWRCYEPGEIIYQQGFESPFLAFLVHGKVKIFTASTEGKQLIVAFNKPLELFGDIEFVQAVNTLHTIETVTQVHCGIYCP